MRHPTEGVLRRLLDEPADVSEDDRAHATDCASCAATMATMREDVALVGAALATDTGTVDVDRAWQRLTSAVPDAPTRPALAGRRRGRLREAARRPVVAGIAVAAVLTGASAAAANDWFEIFRTERVAAVGLSTADLNALPDLEAYGELEVTSAPDVHTVADAVAAARETGLDVPEVAALPRGVRGEPTYQVGGEASATFTFSAERAERAAGDAAPPTPPGLDGSRVRLVAGPGVAAVWTQRSGVPALLVGRAVAPTALSSGVPFAVLRDHLLSLPGMPDDVAAKLRTFDADGSTLPLPVPTDALTTSSAEVDGAPATVLAARDRTMSAVVWVVDGIVTVVAGSLDADEVLTVARELR